MKNKIIFSVFISSIWNIIFILFFLISIINSTYAETKIDDKSKNELEQEIDSLNMKMDSMKDQVYKLKEQIDRISALKIGGFFDVSISNYKNKPNIFAIGDFELDIEHNYKDHLQVAAALVFYEGAELAVGFIDYHLFGGSISPRGRLFVEEGLHIQVGKFDVPFGNDWHHFSVVDRISVTPPLSTEIVMEGGYNDEGIRILANFVSANITLFMVDGIEDKFSFGGNSYGFRIGLTPFSNPYILKKKGIPLFEFGFAYIHDINNTGYVAERAYAFDVESKIAPFIIRSEYYCRDKQAGVVFDGYHVTGAIDLDDVFKLPAKLYTRYDFSRMKNYVPETDYDILTQGIGRDQSLSRITTGININIYRVSYLKAEYQQFLSAYKEYANDEYYSEKLYYLQLVITF